MLGERKIPYPTFSKSHPVKLTTGIILACILRVAANGFAWIWAVAEFADQQPSWRTRLGCGMPSMVIISRPLTALHARCRRQQSVPWRVAYSSQWATRSVVVAGTLSVTAATSALNRRLQLSEAVGGCIATGTSIVVLLGIAVVNLAIFAHVWVV